MLLRFAPAPSNKLHIGNVKALILNWLYSMKNNGKLVLRIDDTQEIEGVDDNILSIQNIIKWLKIDIYKSFRQSERKHIYEKYFNLLLDSGCIYPCYELKDELKTNSIYRRKHSVNTHGREVQYYRFELKSKDLEYDDLILNKVKAKGDNLNDPIIRIGDKFTYLFCSSVDDYVEGITHIIRGNDHSSNTFIQSEIIKAIDPTFKIIFAHYGLFMFNNHKLSKRCGDVIDGQKIKYFYMQNIMSDILPLALVKYILVSGVSSGLNIKSLNSLEEMVDVFEISNLSNNNIQYDEDKILSINEVYIRNMTDEQISNFKINLCFWRLIKDNIVCISDIEYWKKVIIDGDFLYKKRLDNNELECIKLVLDILEKNKYLNSLERYNTLKNHMKNRFFKVLRFCLTGLSYGPGIKELFCYFEYDEMMKRISKNIEG